MLIDTHAHLDFKDFEKDRQTVLDRAQQAGVAAIVTIGVDLATSRAAIALAQTHEQIFATVGFHPHDAKTVNAATLAELRALARRPQVVAIGETGLDFYRDRSPRDVQRRVFRQQLQIAAELAKPVVVHDRDAHQETLNILRQWVAENEPSLPEYRGVLHCFSGDLAMAQAVTKLGFLVGIDGPITYPNAHQLQAIVRALPLSRLLVETDAPFLIPHPHPRKKRNEPAYVQLVAAKIAEIKKLSLEEVAQATTANAQALFQFDVP